MGDLVRVLLVEDKAGDALLVSAYLSETADYEIVTEGRLEGARRRVQTEQFDVILLDLGLPDSTGIDTLRGLQQGNGLVPVVVLTGHNDERLGIEAIQEGAQDYVIKGRWSPDMLRRALRYAMERGKARSELLASRELMHTVIDNLPDAVYVKDLTGRKVLTNPADVAHIAGVSEASEVLGKTDLEVFPRDVALRSMADDQAILDSGVGVLNKEEWGTDADGRATWGLTSKIPLRDADGRITGLVGITRSITQRKIVEIQTALSRDVLLCLNRVGSEQDAIGDILQLVKNSTGIEAVGIRLRDGEDYPYYQTNGFPGHFVAAETLLCVRDEAGELLRDAAGYAVLECMCGNVLRGRTDPRLPFFTGGGSFWSNSTTDLLATTTEEDRQARTRNRCNREGYESVALVPLRMGPEIIGLLQLNDHRPGQFSAEMIAYLEGLGASIGVALSRRRVEEALRESEQRFRRLYEQSPAPYQCTDEEGRLVEVNDAWLAELGYNRHDVIGHAFTEFLAGDGPVLFAARFPRIKERGEVHNAVYELNLRAGGTISASFDGKIVRDNEGRFALAHGVFVNITRQRQAEEALRQRLDELVRWQDVMLDREDRVQELKGEVNALCSRLGETARYSNQEGLDALPDEEGGSQTGMNWTPEIKP